MAPMQTTHSPEPAPPAVTAAAPRKAAGISGRALLGVALGAAALVGLIAWAATSWVSLEGGTVRSTADFAAHVRVTKQAGERTVGRLLFVSSTPDATRETSTSCADDLGFDDGDVTRAEPIYTWSLSFGSRHAYLAAVTDLKADWKRQGYEVEAIPALAKGEPGAGLPGISTKDDEGIELTLGPDSYSGEPELTADGACMRYHDAFDYDYDGDGEPGW